MESKVEGRLLRLVMGAWVELLVGDIVVKYL